MTSTTDFPAERTAIVTGAASRRGIGRATAERLAVQGWSVAILDRDGTACRERAEEISRRTDAEVVGIATDISVKESVDAAVALVEAELPPVVGLVNNAGVSSPIKFTELDTREWDRVFDVNVRGTFLITQRVAAGMASRGLGRIVSVSSISAQRGGGSYSTTAYSASKAALIGFSRSLARELGAHGVTVNCISPGPIDTDIMGGPLSPERRAQMGAETLVGRVGTVDEVAALLSYLLSADAGFITAATYDINGGLHMS